MEKGRWITYQIFPDPFLLLIKIHTTGVNSPHVQVVYRQLLGESDPTLYSVGLHLSMGLVVGANTSVRRVRLGLGPLQLGSLPRWALWKPHGSTLGEAVIPAAEEMGQWW